MTLSKPLIILFAVLSVHSLRARGTWDVFDHGAKGDGISLDTKAIQNAIDQCNQAGGGKVYLHNGKFVSGTLYLKDNVSLYIEAGATLLGSDNLDNYPSIPSKHPSYTGDYVTNKMLIYAEDARNISILGRGVVDGRGDHWVDGPYASPSFSVRPRIIHFRGCENIQVRDITLYNSASWVQSYQSCKNLIIDGITVDSRENKDIEKPRFSDARGRNNDGLDLVDCEKVRISNCYINSGDDAICLKSFSPDEACRDITISNCIVSSNASGIKIGTETAGGFEDITVQNCVVFDTRGDAVSLMSVDGARIERVMVSGVTARNIKGAAVFIRLGARNRPYRKNVPINTPILRDVLIENIKGKRISNFGCSITGLEEARIENIVLRSIDLEFEGGNKVLRAGEINETMTDEEALREIDREVPEIEKSYPNGKMFGRLPSYGFYLRHVSNIALDQVKLRFAEADFRPALICEDVAHINIRNLEAEGTAKTPGLIRLTDVRDALISSCSPSSDTPVFISVRGKRSEGIVCLNNNLKKVTRKIDFKGVDQSVLKEIGTIE